MKAIAYIDGYNLYYGLLKGTPHKWLDLWKFCRMLLKDDIELEEVKYFTALVKPHPYDQAAVDRHKIYLQAVATNPKIKTILGFYRKNNTLMPPQDGKCATCDVLDDGFVPVVKLEEKRSDVNLAVSMVLDAAQNKADTFLVVTGDSDQVGAIEAVRHQFKKQVVVFNPHQSLSKNLDWAASYYKNIPRDLPALCQLPDEISVGTKGNKLRKPERWK